MKLAAMPSCLGGGEHAINEVRLWMELLAYWESCLR